MFFQKLYASDLHLELSKLKIDQELSLVHLDLCVSQGCVCAQRRTCRAPPSAAAKPGQPLVQTACCFIPILCFVDMEILRFKSNFLSLVNYTPRAEVWKSSVWFGLGVILVFTNTFSVQKHEKCSVDFLNRVSATI
jgi:hypothetical protein